MKISLEWVSDFVDLPHDVPVADLAHELTLKTVEVEDYFDLGAKLTRVVVGRIDTLKPVGDQGPMVATCDIGPAGPVTVVTRSKELSPGQLVAVALVGAQLTVPGGERSGEVTVAEIAGILSEGAICTAANLGLHPLFPYSRGGRILDLRSIGAEPGTPLADALHYNDFVLEIDNKSLTNRPDLWGHYGIARELAAIYGRELKPLPAAARPPQVEGLIGNLDPELCRRLAVVEFTMDNHGQAPLWLRSRLARIGENTVNLCVDLSNYVMFTVGQPNHAYDKARITLPLSVRKHQTTARLELLTAESRELDPSTPVILDANMAVALAGIMGGASTAVSTDSHRFALEVASFRPTVVRRASQQLAVRTEASARFEKGLDTQRVDAALDFFLDLLQEVVADATVTSMQDVTLDPTEPAHVEVDVRFLETRIGQRLSTAKIRDTLGSLGFTVDEDSQHLRVTVPTWRSTGDVSMPHDIIEEVARLHGYDNLPAASLPVTLKPARSLHVRPLSRVLREELASRADMQEVITYPWVADAMLAAAGLSKSDTIQFDGAPAPDRDSLRPYLVPNLLEAIARNLRYRQAFEIFEVGEVFRAGPFSPYHGAAEPLPDQRNMLAAALVGHDGAELFRRAKGVLEMLHQYGHLVALELVGGAEPPPWADRSARLTVCGEDRRAVGAVGLLTKRCRRLAGISEVEVVCFELDLGQLSAYPSRENRYEPISDLPEADFDLSVVVADAVRWQQISESVSNTSNLVRHIAYVGEFRGSWVPGGHRSLTFRVTLLPKADTLDSDDIAATRADVLAALEREHGAYLRESG